MVPPRVVATDLDGTLLRSDGSVSARTVAALDSAAAYGIRTVLVTARPPRWMHDLAHVVGDHGIAICGNGAFIYDVAARRVVEAHVFAPDALAEVVADVRAAVPGIRLAAECVSGLWVEAGWPNPHREVDVDRRRQGPLADLLASDDPQDGVGKLLGLVRGWAAPDFLAAVQEAVGDRAVLAYSGAFGLAELNPPGVTKAAALERWCAELGIAREEVWAFGDMPNDLPMLRWAGRSFAVANADPEVLAVTTDRCPSNDEDGVAQVIEAQIVDIGDVDRVFETIAALAGRPRTVTALPGGLTNRNYRVRTATDDVVVRISPPTTGLLAVDRDAEHHNSIAAAAAGVGAPVLDYQPGRGVLVVEFIPDAVTYAESDVAANLTRVATAVRTLHSGPAFVNRFDIFDIQRRYLDIMRDKGFRLPNGYVDLLPRAGEMERALGRHPEPLVPCHNDLLAANFLDDGTRVWIIDYEYSGNNAPGFELGNIAQESHLSDDQLAELVAAYAGGVDETLVARARLWGIASAYAWTLWGAIQDGIAPEDYDFWGWGMEKFERARSAMTGRSFGALLDVVGRGP